MSKRTNRQLFENEMGVLRAARQTASDTKFAGNELTAEYTDLANHYERLLRLSMKIFNISDIQGEHLKQHEAEMARINGQLQQMENARRQLITDISHELGTPMTSIQGYIKAMIDGIISPTPHYLKLVYDKITHVNRLVDELFEISKLESSQTVLHYSDYSLNELEHLLNTRLEQEVCGQGYRFELEGYQGDVSPEDVRLAVDMNRIEQAAFQLAYYAMRRTPPGGRIALRFELQEGRDDSRHDGGGERCELHVIISDSGGELDQANFSLLLDRSQRTDLGLAIAKIIVLKHQGHMGVREQGHAPGNGGRVYFALPAVVKNADKGTAT